VSLAFDGRSFRGTAQSKEKGRGAYLNRGYGLVDSLFPDELPFFFPLLGIELELI
jgi:hypothetical protein